MGKSFSISSPLQAKPTGVRRKVLVTGASGNIGRYFAEHSHERYDLRLHVRQRDEDSKAIERFGDVMEGELADLDRLKELCAGMDTVLHLAGAAEPSSTWEEVLEHNIVGSYHAFVAARSARCRRFIYASSIHAISGYPSDVQVKPSDPVNPGDLYGVSKCFGEALGRYMAEQESLPVICLRIGGFQPVETARSEAGIELLDAWVSQRDLNQLIERCIDAEGIEFAIFSGLSDNRFKRMDISNARQLLGYEPKDDATREQPGLKGLQLARRVASHSVRDAKRKSGIRRQVKDAKA